MNWHICTDIAGSPEKRKKLLGRIALVSAGAVFLFVLCVYLWFTEDGQGAGIPCPIHLLTGLYCPGCGSSRALRAVLHLDFYQALRYNAVVTILLPFAAVYAALLVCSFVLYGEDRISRHIPVRALWWLLGAVILFGVLRNLPWFTFLAPTKV